MPATYEPIATSTLTASATSFTFSSIPSTYTDLHLVVVGLLVANSQFRLTFNGDSGSNYSYTRITGDGAAASSGRATPAVRIDLNSATAVNDQPALATVDVFNYANTSVFKTALSEFSNDRNGGGSVQRTVGLWRDTSAITSLRILAGGDFASGSTATLYGILKA
jgi:hypothetical protein